MSKKFLVPLVLPADPIQPLEAATKQYVDTSAGGTGNFVSYMLSPTTTEPPTGSRSGSTTPIRLRPR